MSFYKMFDFLRSLEKNNSKAWMDDHRDRYEEIRDWFINWLDELNNALLAKDSNYTDTPGRKAIGKINNNLKFHPGRETYKNHFGADLNQSTNGFEFNLHIGTAHSFIGGGYYKPSSVVLKRIRHYIADHGKELNTILENPDFKKNFGSLLHIDPLKNAPRDFDADHPYIDLLNHQSFAVKYDLTQKDILEDHFMESVVQVHLRMAPFQEFLNAAVNKK